MRNTALLFPMLMIVACGRPGEPFEAAPAPDPGTRPIEDPSNAPMEVVDAGTIPEIRFPAPEEEATEVASLPSQLLDLSSWKLTLPVAGDSGSSPREVKQPELAEFSLAPYFRINDAGDAVVFRAPAGGFTTSGSSYPRSELREMTADGRELASWSTTEGTHTLILRQTITSQPVVKPHVVAGQIHDAEDDVLMIRLEGTRLFVERGGDEVGLLDANYALGTPMTVKLVASGGHVQIFYNDLTTPSVDVAVSASGCYFKAGAYTQSNQSKGDAPEAAGEVVIHSLDLSHE